MRLSIVLVFIFFINFSCKKEEDTTQPFITITLPSDNLYFDVLDTIWIRAKITDNEIVKSVSYSIADDNSDCVTGIKSKVYNSNSVDFVGYIILNDVRLETGNYSIVLSAFDGKNTKRVFKKIYISELPKKLENIFIVTENSNISKIYELNNQLNFDLKYTLNDKISDVAINSYFKTIYILDKSGNLNAKAISNFETIWEANNLNNNLVEYNGKLLIKDDYCYASVKYNNIEEFDINGNVRNTAVSELFAFEPSYFTIQNDFFVNFTYNNSISSNYIEKLYFESGASQSYYPIDFDALAVLPLNTNEVIIFGNKFDTMRVATLKLDATHIQYTDLLFTEKLKTVAKIDDDKFLFSTETGIYMFEESANNYYSIRNDIYANYLYQEEITKQIYCVNNNTIEIINPPYYNTLNTINLPDSTVGVLFNYNK